MTRQQLSAIICNIDDRHIAEAIVYQPEEAFSSRQKISPIRKKRIATLALAAVLILSLGIVAYAANLFGLRELYSNPNRGDMPDEAADLIVSQSAKTEGTGWSARVLETFCDEGTVLVTVQVSADSQYLVVPIDEDPNSPLWTIGLPGEGTLGDYARREGKTLLFAEAVLDGEALGLTTAGMNFESISPREMVICFEGTRKGGASAPVETNCTVVVVTWSPEAQNADSALPERCELPITLVEGKSTPLGTYIPTDPHSLPGFELGKLILTQTPLGISLQLQMHVIDEEKAETLLTLRLDGVEFHGSGSIDPNGYAIFGQGQGDFGENPIIRFYDWDKQLIGEIVFQKSSEP